MRTSVVTSIALVAWTGAARAADMPLKAPAAPAASAADAWSGFYAGADFGYAAGRSNWSARSLGGVAAPVSGSFNLFEAYHPLRGTGSYFGGLHAGYDRLLPSRVLLGIEADIAFPNTIAGSSILAAPALGIASYSETIELSGTLRGRLGYAFNHWLLYSTAGFAWSYDEFTRTQLAAAPLGGTTLPGDSETSRKVRTGWAAGVGVEMPVAPGWTARAEYLFSDFSSRGIVFPAGAQRVDADLAMNSVRLGLNYKFDPAKPDALLTLPSAPETDLWAFHAQTTYVHQYAPPFRAPYQGRNSLASNQGRETWDVTLYGGLRLWQGAEFWINPEIDQGFGLSSTVGAAGFPSGEAYKVGASVPYMRIPRMFVRQTIDLGGDSEKVDGDANKFSGKQTANRLVFTVGKFSVGDVFDTNKYAHDPRGDFLNWAVADSGTFDYAADAWAYTYGGAAEWYQGDWTVRAGVFDLSVAPNSSELDPSFSQFQWIGELEHRHQLWGQPGKLAVTGFLTRGRMGRFADAIALANVTGGPADITAVRQYRSRPGVSLNAEQQLTDGIGAFVRAGIADGRTEPYEFTDIDRTVAGGLSLSGKLWGRSDDTVGLAGVVNTISSEHQAFLNAGGLGILVGDGQLPHPGAEKIFEAYYSLPVRSWRVTFDYQFITNPAYNRDRGPVSVLGTRLHAAF